MKHLIILLAALACLTSCRNIRGNRNAAQELKTEIEAKNAAYTAKNDSMDHVSKFQDSLLAVLEMKRDSMYLTYKENAERLAAENKALQRRVDSMQVASDTLAARLLHARLMIENARYYLRIANRSPSQQKFLRGWMNRALEVK